MSIFFPIGGEQDAAANGSAEVAGSTTISALGTLRYRGVAGLAGKTSISALGTYIVHRSAQVRGKTSITARATLKKLGSAQVAGRTIITARGRRDFEGTNAGAAAVAGSTSIVARGGVRLTSGGAQVAGHTIITAEGSVTNTTPDFGFIFIVDVLDSAIAAAQARRVRRYDARLFVNGSPVPILSATLTAPPDALGSQLSIILARPDISLVPVDAAFDFDVGIWDGSQFLYERKIAGGALNARSKRIINNNDLPADTVQLTIFDVIADRWNRAPRAQTLYYDPAKVDAPEAQAYSDASIYDEQGERIAPEFNAVRELSLYSMLEAAYVDGCGFDSYVTNIQDFPVEQASFSITGGYDAGVRPLLSPFAPVVFAVGNVLWILDMDAPPPAGLPSPREFTVTDAKEIADDLPAREPANAILVKLRRAAGEGDASFTLTISDPPVETGTFGAPNYTVTQTQRQVRRWFNTAEPSVILREDLLSLETTTEDYQFNIVGRETETDNYDGLGRKTSHTRMLEMLLPDFDNDGEPLLQEAQSERQTIIYGANPLKPTEDVILRVETEIAGLILVDSGNQYLHKDYRIPYLEAHRSGIIDPDAEQHTEQGAIKTMIETLREQGGQVQIETRIINHITNAPDRVQVTNRPGKAAVERSAAGTRSVLLTLPDTEFDGRRVQEFDGTALPFALAMMLARRKLARLSAPPKELNNALAYPDLTVRRGTQMRVRERAGALLGDYIARGWTLTVNRNETTTSLEASLSVQTRQLLT
jgi:hypothetical protein